MGSNQDSLPVFPDRNITAPDSDDGETKDKIDLTSPTDGETNKSVDHSYNETIHPPKVIIYRYDHTEDDVDLSLMPIMNPEDLVGYIFLLGQQEDGQKFRERMLELLMRNKIRFITILSPYIYFSCHLYN